MTELRQLAPIRVEVSAARGESQADFLRRTGMYGVVPSDTDTEATSKLNAVAEQAALSAGLARDQAASLVLPQNIFTTGTLAAAEGAVTVGTTFKWVNAGIAQVRKRTSGGSDLIYSEATTAKLAAADGATVIGFGTRTVADELGERLPVTRSNSVVGDGVADDSAAVQAFFNANRGRTIVFPAGRRFKLGNILMSGATWNGTRVIVEEGCELIQAGKPGSASGLTHGIWTLFTFHLCDNVAIDVRGVLDGNRAAQPDIEQVHLVMVAGCQGVSIPNLRVKEYQGDGLYITSELTTGGRLPDRIDIGAVTGWNSVPAGRNLLSIIAGSNIDIETVRGVNVGGKIGGISMPGGFDIEPNNVNQLVRNVTVGSINVTGAGTTMVAVHGRPDRTDITSGVIIGQAIVTNVFAPATNDENGNLTQHAAQLGKVRWASDVTIKEHRGRHTNGYGIGVEVMCADRVKISSTVLHVHTGLLTAVSGYTVNLVSDSDIEVNANDVARFGHSLFNLSRTTVRGTIMDVRSEYYTSRFGVVANATLTDVTMSVSVRSHANWTRSYRNNGATYNNTVIADCDLSGSGWAAELNRVGDMQVSRRRVRGVTSQSAQPAAGLWKAGDFVESSGVTVATGKVLQGWKRLTDGNAHVLNTDWKQVWGTDS